MRTLAFIILMSLNSIGWGQASAPWNPDANNDSYVGAADMISTLSVYGQQVGIDSSITCDYQGSVPEQFVYDVLNGVISLDSILIQYSLSVVDSFYVVGCPDPVYDTLDIERAYTISPTTIQPWDWDALQDVMGYSRRFRISFNDIGNTYSLSWYDYELWVLNGQGWSFSSYAFTRTFTPGDPIPFDLNEDGIVFNNLEDIDLEYFQIIPFWHYAD